MSSYTDGLKDAIRNAVCRVSDALDAATQYTFGTQPGAIKLPLCNDPVPPPPPPPPFEGGQCAGVNYRGSWFIPGTQTSVVSFSASGPIGGLANGDVISESGNQTTRRYGFIGRNAQGNDVPLFSEVTRLTSEGPLDFSGLTRIDGQPDDCGDPLPEEPPPPGVQPISFTYTNNEGDDIDVSGDINIGGPILIGPFTIVAPITLDLGGIQFDGSISLDPEFNIEISPSFGGSGDGPGGDEPVEPIDPDEDDPDEDEPDEPVECVDKPIKGLVVSLNFSSGMSATELIQDGSIASIGVPRVATLYFEALAGNRRVRLPGIDLKSRTQLVPTPYNATVVCWRIHTESGVSIRRVRPIFDIPT